MHYLILVLIATNLMPNTRLYRYTWDVHEGLHKLGTIGALANIALMHLHVIHLSSASSRRTSMIFSCFIPSHACRCPPIYKKRYYDYWIDPSLHESVLILGHFSGAWLSTLVIYQPFTCTRALCKISLRKDQN